MTEIKLCGLSRECDIESANMLMPEYVGFVFAEKSRRYVSEERAASLKAKLAPGITAVGVFVNENVRKVAQLLNTSVIDIAQLHGAEDEGYISELRALTDKPVIKAFGIKFEKDIMLAEKCSADYVLLDCGSGGTGSSFDWSIAKKIKRPYFLAGGLDVDNVCGAIEYLAPYAVDVSSGIETNGYKDIEKMKNFVYKVRKEKI